MKEEAQEKDRASLKEDVSAMSSEDYKEKSPIKNLTDEQQEIGISEKDIDENQKPINFITAWLIPGVAIFALCYLCLKSSTYGLLFWLPYIL